MSAPSPWLDDAATIDAGPVAPDLLVLKGNAASAEAKAWTQRWNQGSAVDVWLDQTLALIVKHRLNPLRAGRALTLASVAMHDAANAAMRLGLRDAGQRAAIHGAASKTLDYLFPAESSGRLGALGHSALTAVATANSKELMDVSKGAYIGDRIAELVRARAMYDGADETWDPRTRPSSSLGEWKATPPMESAHPQEPLGGSWKTWVLRAGEEVRPPRPPGEDSAEVIASAREVLHVSRNLTPGQRKIADTWHLDQGTVTPPGIWNGKARALLARDKIPEQHRARIYAALNVAMMDAAISCWQAKYTWWTKRLITVIRERLDPTCQSYLVTPMHPSYVSGHAAVSGAAAEVLKFFFPSEKRRLDAWAGEAAM
ncbi:MAG: hypothetical protein EXR36_08450 [Betaproteobacteria bacterium]|nr:hypothetical protein [Betaproteobacteria bacterium]